MSTGISAQLFSYLLHTAPPALPWTYLFQNGFRVVAQKPYGNTLTVAIMRACLTYLEAQAVQNEV